MDAQKFTPAGSLSFRKRKYFHTEPSEVKCFGIINDNIKKPY
jgi:hypothetical protein